MDGTVRVVEAPTFPPSGAVCRRLGRTGCFLVSQMLCAVLYAAVLLVAHVLPALEVVATLCRKVYNYATGHPPLVSTLT